MIRHCIECGKEFDARGTAAYCAGPHYRKCEVCGDSFVWDYKNPKKCCSRSCASLLRKKTISSEVRTCELCGKEFHPESSTQRYCKNQHYLPCPICNKPVPISLDNIQPKCCSLECSNKLREATCIEKYGVKIASQNPDVRKKLHDIAVDFEHSEARKSTVRRRYGVENVAQAAAVREKISATVRSAECQSKIRSTMVERYGVAHPMQSDELRSKYVDTVRNKYDVPYYCMTEECKAAQGHIISRCNRVFGQELERLSIPYKFEHRIDDFSYDIELLGQNTLIEINPTYTHNAIGNHWGTVIDKNYHKTKTQRAKESGYRCINVWDWDNHEKILNLLREKKTIYARNCSIRKITSTDACRFENLYHLQGSCRGQEVCLGLYYADKLVQVMTFGKPRYNAKFEWELLRLCSDSSFRVVGGSERLWKHFLSMNSPRSVVSYCDLSKFSGDVYGRLGMRLAAVAEPNKMWSKGTRVVTDNLLRQRGFDQLFGTHYGKGTSNEELMLQHGWLPVYDCGQARYEYHDPASDSLPDAI